MRKMLKEQKVTDKRERKAAQKSMKALKKMQVKGLSDSTNTADSTADGRSTPKLYAAEELGADATPMRVKHNPLRRPSLMDENVDGTNEGPLSPAAPKGVAARNGGKWKSKSAWCTVQGEGCRLQAAVYPPRSSGWGSGIVCAASACLHQARECANPERDGAV